MREVTVSINPTYYCNFSCDFCYLTPQQLRDRLTISSEQLEKRLQQITAHTKIKGIDLYGGEIGILKREEFYDLKRTIKKYYTGSINIITNYSMIHDWFFDADITLSVSYDFEAREKNGTVYQNMLMAEKPLYVLVLASKKLIDLDVDSMIHELNLCSAVSSVEIKPYSTNQANCHSVSHKDFENFVIKWLESPVDKKFEFINEYHIQDSLDKIYNSFSDDHVYITPKGNFAVLEFDLNDNEYFLELNSFEEYIAWAEKEKQSLSPICQSCPFKGHCLTEHYRYVRDLTNSCNGYRGLLEYYERMEDTSRDISQTQY
jgi:sulfatase maturation enzyme AslB (radical SAM superfamily)